LFKSSRRILNIARVAALCAADPPGGGSFHAQSVLAAAPIFRVMLLWRRIVQVERRQHCGTKR
jgi:hypothetical protein